MLTANVGYLMAQRKKTTLLVDLDLNYSQLVHFFDIKSKYTIISLLENLDHLDSATLPSLLPAYQNSLHLLPGPARLEEAEAVTPENLEKIIRTLKTTQFFQWILLDVGNRPNEIALKALELANELVLVTVPSVPALLNTRKFLKLLHIIGLENLTLHLLVNIWKKNGNLTLPEAAKLLGREVSFTVSCNYEEVGRSINEGRPLAELSPRLPISRDLEQVAAGLMGDRGPEENGLLGNIFKFFKGKG
jgi:pilus assembly protein CpaE